jgi:hypothetical protein
VSEPISEHTRIVGISDGLLVINRERVWADGAKLGGDFMCEIGVAGWLAEHLDRAANEQVSEIALDAPPDHLLLFVRGGDRGSPINIHVHNRRDSTAIHGRPFTLSGMSPQAARALAIDLRAFDAKDA